MYILFQNSVRYYVIPYLCIHCRAASCYLQKLYNRKSIEVDVYSTTSHLRSSKKDSCSYDPALLSVSNKCVLNEVMRYIFVVVFIYIMFTLYIGMVSIATISLTQQMNQKMSKF